MKAKNTIRTIFTGLTIVSTAALHAVPVAMVVSFLLYGI